MEKHLQAVAISRQTEQSEYCLFLRNRKHYQQKINGILMEERDFNLSASLQQSNNLYEYASAVIHLRQ